jgi:hypothetical protein
VNHFEHIARRFDNREWRLIFWEKQCARYGVEAMMEWVESLPVKIRGRMDFVKGTLSPLVEQKEVTA